MFVARCCYFYEKPNLGIQKTQQLLKEDFVKMVDTILLETKFLCVEVAKILSL